MPVNQLPPTRLAPRSSAHPRARPGFILFVQTFGDLVNFNPHVHALVADGVFDASGRFIPLPPVPEALLAERLRREVLALLVRREAILPPLAGQMLAWCHSGFSVHNQVRVAAGDAEGRRSLAGYMLLLAMSSNAINASLYHNLRFSFERDAAHVASIARIPLALVVTT